MKSSKRKVKVVKLKTDKVDSTSNADNKDEGIQHTIRKNLQEVYFDSLKKIDDLLSDKTR